MDRQCSSCGGFCKKSGCERENVQPEQTPVAWHHPDCEGECIACLIERAIESEYGTQGVSYLRRHVTAPPQREWQGLTDEDIEAAFMANTCCDDLVVFEHVARAIEAKLKEKNT